MRLRRLIIFINHLTRMREGHFCAAGLDAITGKHVRPVLRRRNLSTGLLARNGGPFDMAVAIQLDRVRLAPSTPETEDYLFDPRRARALGTVSRDRFWTLLCKVAKPTLSELFGPDLVRRGAASCAVDKGKGEASLGCLVPKARPILLVKHESGKDKIRMKITDGEFHLDLGVTDMRLYQEDYVTPDRGIVERVARRLASQDDAILSVGLTRPFAKTDEQEPVHWLQVNNIHLKENPVWQLG
jgi:hypothetical protein